MDVRIVSSIQPETIVLKKVLAWGHSHVNASARTENNQTKWIAS